MDHQTSSQVLLVVLVALLDCEHCANLGLLQAIFSLFLPLIIPGQLARRRLWLQVQQRLEVPHALPRSSGHTALAFQQGRLLPTPLEESP